MRDTERAERRICLCAGIVLVLAAAALALLDAAEPVCDLGIVGGVTRLFKGERHELLAAFLREARKPAAALLLAAGCAAAERFAGRRAAAAEHPGKWRVALPRLLRAAMLLAAGALTAYTVSRYVPIVSAERDIFHMRRALQEDRFILHAGGYFPGADGEPVSYTNSREALDRFAEESATRFLELDFLVTTDREILCSHGWHWITVDGEPLEDAVPYAAAKDGLYRDTPYHVASLDDVIALIDRRPDTVIITDDKDENILCMSLIAKKYPAYRDHFLVQIYHAEEYDEIAALGYRYILYTLYRTKKEERRSDVLLALSRHKNLVAFTFPANWADPVEKPKRAVWMERMRAADVPLLGHTVNGEAEQAHSFSLGFAGLYTDEEDHPEEARSGSLSIRP